MLIAGNRGYGLGEALYKIFPTAEYVSRSSGRDLTSTQDQTWFARQSLGHDQVIICSALHDFNQTILLDLVYKASIEKENSPHIICVGSTTDRVSDGKPWLYNAEKKSLRDYCNTLALGGVWKDRAKITYISLGTLSNNQHKHLERKCMDIDLAAEYIKWIIEQPRNININEISIDPMQHEKWHND